MAVEGKLFVSRFSQALDPDNYGPAVYTEVHSCEWARGTLTGRLSRPLKELWGSCHLGRPDSRLERLRSRKGVGGMAAKPDREKPLTEAELVLLRERMDDWLGPQGELTGDTCEGCDRRFVCEYVWDPYNRDGDCLWGK